MAAEHMRIIFKKIYMSMIFWLSTDNIFCISGANKKHYCKYKDTYKIKEYWKIFLLGWVSTSEKGIGACFDEHFNVIINVIVGW